MLSVLELKHSSDVTALMTSTPFTQLGIHICLLWLNVPEPCSRSLHGTKLLIQWSNSNPPPATISGDVSYFILNCTDFYKIKDCKQNLFSRSWVVFPLIKTVERKEDKSFIFALRSSLLKGTCPVKGCIKCAMECI